VPQTWVEFRIFRPSIVIGAAPATSGGMPSNLFFAFIRALMALTHSRAGLNASVRIQACPQTCFQIVPVEYVTAAIEQLTFHRQASGETFHLVSANPPSQKTVAEMISARLGLNNLHLLESSEELSDPSPLEARLARMLLPYKEYLQQDVRFDCSCTLRLLENRNLQPPIIDIREMDRLVALAAHSGARLEEQHTRLF
jgi:nucleoside-diphosphate-sugar epimerase